MTSILSKAFRKCRESDGFATGTVLVIVGVMSVIALSIMALNNTLSARDLRFLHFHNSLDIIHANIFAFGQNTDAFRHTLIYNNDTYGRMACIRAGTNCSTPSTFNNAQSVALVWPDDTVYYNINNASRNGFTLNGVPCAFNATRVVNGCILQIDLRWTPFCNNVPCMISSSGPNRLIFLFEYAVPTRDAANVNALGKYVLPLEITNYNGPLNVLNHYR